MKKTKNILEKIQKAFNIEIVETIESAETIEYATPAYICKDYTVPTKTGLMNFAYRLKVKRNKTNHKADPFLQLREEEIFVSAYKIDTDNNVIIEGSCAA